MKRVFAMVFLAMMATGLSSCWDKAEKKDQNKADSQVQQSDSTDMLDTDDADNMEGDELDADTDSHAGQ